MITSSISTQEQQPKSLSGIRVLDLSRVLAGPFCSMILADMGAEVIKVESPWGDDSRQLGPDANGESAYFRLFNRSKKGITLDLKNPDDVNTLKELALRSDVLVENYRPGVMEKLGLSPKHLLEINPRLIVTSISGFGQQGSMSAAPAYDLVAQAMSGIMSVTGWPDGRPTRIGVSIGDLIPGMYAAIGTLGALHERSLTGKGQHVDIAMFDSLTSILESVGMRALYEKEIPSAVGSDHAMTVPFAAYSAANGEVVIAVLNDKQFAKLTNALGIADMAEDPRFMTNSARRENRDLVRKRIEEALRDKTVEEALKILQAHAIPSSPVLNVNEALHGNIGQERAVVFTESDGFKTLASPIRLKGSQNPFPAPKLGEHNSQIAHWLTEPTRNS